MPYQAHVTIKEVAEKAKVSIQTVSRVLNNRPDVSLETRQRVQQVINELSYRPFAVARGLASNRTYMLGLVATDFSDFWFAQVVTGADIEAREHGYFFLLGSSTDTPQEEPTYIRLLTERHVDGILFVRATSPEDLDYLSRLQRDGIPVVTTGFYLPEAKFGVIDVNNIEGGRKAVQYLIELGHTQIAMITGPAGLNSVNDRMEGYRQALESAGIVLNPDLIAQGDWLYPSGYKAMRTLLGRRIPFTAVFAQNDRIARGAMSALNEASLRVPKDVSIIGYDDSLDAQFSNPPLTTIRQPMQEVGKTAARLLIQMIEDPQRTPLKMMFDTELVVRSSCAHPPQKNPQITNEGNSVENVSINP